MKFHSYYHEDFLSNNSWKLFQTIVKSNTKKRACTYIFSFHIILDEVNYMQIRHNLVEKHKPQI